MTFNNLAICVGPNLLSPPKEELLPLDALLEVTQKVNMLVECMITNYRDIFGEGMAGLSPTTAKETSEPMDRSTDGHVEEPRGPGGRADKDHQVKAFLDAPSSLLDNLKESGGDTVVEGETAEASPPIAPKSAAESLEHPEELRSLSEDRRFAGSLQEKEKGRNQKRRQTHGDDSDNVVEKKRRKRNNIFGGGTRKRYRNIQRVRKPRRTVASESGLGFVLPMTSDGHRVTEEGLFLGKRRQAVVEMENNFTTALAPRLPLDQLWVLSGGKEAAQEDENKEEEGSDEDGSCLIFIWPSGSCVAHFGSQALKELWLSTLLGVIPSTGLCQPHMEMEVNLVTRQELLALLRQEGPSTEGIFRRAASGTALRELREALDRGLDIDMGSQPADLLAVALKDFLRNIPSKLLVEDLYEEWMAAMENTSTEETVEALKVVSKKLPAVNLLLLKELMSLLQHIGHNAATSRMTFNNLAICVGPNLLSPPKEELLPLDALLEVTQKVNMLVEFTIKNYSDIFGEEAAGLSCSSAKDSPVPMKRSTDGHVEEQSGPTGRADKDHQVKTFLDPSLPPSAGQHEKAERDRVVEGKKAKGKMDAIHKLKIFVMFLSLATFTVMVILNAGNATGKFKGLFRATPGNISAKYNTDFTPAGWTFLIWNVIYAWQLAWLLYALSGICRRSELGCVYIKPDLLPIPFYVLWILNNGLNVGWLFLWDWEYLLPALVFLVALTLTTYAALFISHRALSIYSSCFVKGHKAELWLIRILVQNGLALYATWTTIATLLNFAVVLIYKWNVSNETATTASLSILALYLVIWFYLENFFFDKYVCYNLTIYPVVIIALTGSACKNYSLSSSKTNSVFIVVLLAATCLIFAVRLGIVTWRHCKRLEAAETLDASGTVA
ncbi:putative LOC102086399 [Columba livia]|uniref:Putative LOC102086399 n=1 Tax=Columba livia TaxID=8932 RepID=A0A2I0LT19_COLLI|nr:putative LOC102086399 [Columba livia]